MVKWLADKYNLAHNTEYARKYLTQLPRKYTETDLYTIAKGQMDSEPDTQETFVCDTDILTLIVWMEVVYGKCDVQWYNTFKHYENRFYFLLKPDIPWQSDPLRENPNDRDMLFDIYKWKLDYFGKKYAIISGIDNQRLENLDIKFRSI
jgi:nicotinamide riboside kinase